jgi:RNA polymerase sigma-70 factor (ECF subfamily)
VVEVTENFVDLDEPTDSQIEEMRIASLNACWFEELPPYQQDSLADAAAHCSFLGMHPEQVVSEVTLKIFQAMDCDVNELAGQCCILRDIIGNPFRPVVVDPAWRTNNVVPRPSQSDHIARKTKKLQIPFVDSFDPSVSNGRGEESLTDWAGMDHDWQNGNPAAFAALVRQWQQPVARLIFHLLGREAPVPDLCQEVFLRVYQHRSRYQETGALPSWLYRIALNVVRDAERRRKKEPLTLENEEPTDVSPSPDSACEQAECGRWVTQALAELPEPQRLVVVLRHYQGLSFEQIARLLDEPASTIKSRFSAAFQRLRARLRPLADDPSESKP